MSYTYAKVFSSIVMSSVWTLPPMTKLVWLTMLTQADADGFVRGSAPGLAQMVGCTLEETEAALESFMSPDPYSSTKDNEGRRLETVDGGWRLLNHDKYRHMSSHDELKEKKAARQARWRDRKKTAAEDGGKSTQRLQESTRVSLRRLQTHTKTETDIASQKHVSSDYIDWGYEPDEVDQRHVRDIHLFDAVTEKKDF